MKPEIDILDVIEKINSFVKDWKVTSSGKPLHGQVVLKFQDGIFQIGEYNVKWK